MLPHPMADLTVTTTSPVRRTVYELGAGLALGFVAASLIGPRMISWWYEPPSQTALSCGASVNDALAGFVRLQLVTAAVGAVLVWLVLFLVRRSLRKRREQKPIVLP